jgi:hypothetical protein
MALPNLLEYRKHGLDLRKNQAEIAKNKPSEHQPEIEAIDEFKAINQTRKSPWQALIDGASAGMKYGLKSQDNEKKRKVFEALEGYAMAARQQNDMNEKREGDRAAIEPYAKAVLEASYSGLPYDEANQKIQNFWNQAQIERPDLIQGTYVGFNPKTGFINYIKPDGKPDVYDVSHIAGEDAVKNIKSNYLEQQKVDTQNRLANSTINLHNVQADYLPKTLNIRQQEADTAAINANTKIGKVIHETVGEGIKAADEFLRDAPRIKEIVKRNPGIFQSLSQLQWSNQDPTYIDMQLRKLVDMTKNPQDKQDIAILTKFINKMQINVSKGFTRPNQFLEKKGSASVPNFGMPPEAFLKVFEHMEEDYKHSRSRDEKILKAIDKTKASDFTKAWGVDESSALQDMKSLSTEDLLKIANG